MAKDANKKYYYALGRRKTSVASVRLYEGEGVSTVNGKDCKEIYPSLDSQSELDLPLKVTGNKKNFYFSAHVKGGGVSGQLGAIRLGISRALVVFDETLKGDLKAKGLMTRDPRMVERKKTGLRKARRAHQFSKR